MSDELERLEAALGGDVPEPPAQARERAVAAAMSAFDRHQQTVADVGRRAGWAGETVRSWLRGLASPNSNTYLAFAGAAAFALVAVFVVYMLPLSQFSQPEVETPEVPDVARSIEETQFDAPNVAEAVSERTQPEPIELPEAVPQAPYVPPADALAITPAPAVAADSARETKTMASKRGAPGAAPGENAVRTCAGSDGLQGDCPECTGAAGVRCSHASSCPGEYCRQAGDREPAPIRLP